MQVLILDEEQVEELADLNGNGPGDRRLECVELVDGRRVLNADLLEDCAPGSSPDGPQGTWAHWAEFLDSLEIDEVEAGDFVVENVE